MNKLLAIVSVGLVCSAASYAGTTRKITDDGATPPQHVKSKRDGGSTAKFHSSQSASSHSKGKRSRRAKSLTRWGQRAIDGERVREIQQALIREKYLDGKPSGVWDQRSKNAMSRFQSDNGWQSKVVPDSRALIKLGLGPRQANLINPQDMDPALPRDGTRDMRPGGAVPQR